LPPGSGEARSGRVVGRGHLCPFLAPAAPGIAWIGNLSVLSPSASKGFLPGPAPDSCPAMPRRGHISARAWGKRGYYRGWGRLILSPGGRGSGMPSLTTASDVDERTPRVFTRLGRADADRAFRAAVRHSRHVRILRLAIPLTAAIVIVAGAAVSYVLKPLSGLSGIPVDVGSMVVSGTKIKMNQPRLAGATRDNRRYDMVAQAAAQDLPKPDMVEL